jgi:hypothetical protein
MEVLAKLLCITGENEQSFPFGASRTAKRAFTFAEIHRPPPSALLPSFTIGEQVGCSANHRFAVRASRGAGATVGGALGTPGQFFIGLAAPKKESATFFHPPHRAKLSRRPSTFMTLGGGATRHECFLVAASAS